MALCYKLVPWQHALAMHESGNLIEKFTGSCHSLHPCKIKRVSNIVAECKHRSLFLKDLISCDMLELDLHEQPLGCTMKNRLTWLFRNLLHISVLVIDLELANFGDGMVQLLASLIS